MARLAEAFNKEVAESIRAETAKRPKVETAATDARVGGNGNLVTRPPTAAERVTQRNAEAFLREVIAPSESSKQQLSDSPSALVDPAEMAAWKASAGARDPRFFRQTRRNVLPAPPVKIAILVDVSFSMDVLQQVSAELSWALAAAATDLQNFAGRGQQIQTTTIHWGTSLTVVQENGKAPTGISTRRCTDGTVNLGEAMAAIGDQIPGFFEISGTPENRLIVHFTDWQLSPSGASSAREWTQKALEAGVNILSITPIAPDPLSSYCAYREVTVSPPNLLRGQSVVAVYDPKNPGSVWAKAKNLLAL